MLMFKKVLLLIVGFISCNLFAQSVIFPDRVTRVTNYHATVGTTTAAAIATVSTDVIGWEICNDAVNTSTFLAVGQAADVSTDGVVLGLGQCFKCPNCTNALLKLMKVEGQAASNGYSVIQYRK